MIDLADYPAAVYNSDNEEANGLPETIQALKAAIADHDAMMTATPEYNGSPPPLLVNSFSWASRPAEGEASCQVYAGKPVAIMATSPGGLGGVRVTPRLRDFMAELGAVAIPGFATDPAAFDNFDETGALKSEQSLSVIADLAKRLVASV